MMFQCMLLDDKGLSERNVSQNRLNERLIDDKSGLKREVAYDDWWNQLG